jgi:hypothetical protein
MSRTEEPPPVVGRLEGVGMPELIWDVCRRRKTGALHLSRGSVERRLFITEGRIIFAASTDPNDRLGETLLRQSKITLAQLEEALSIQLTGKRLGTLMVESGVLDPEDLVAAVAGQVKAVVLDLLTWTRGEYRFEEGPVPEEDIQLGISTGELLLEGLRGIRSCKMVTRGVGPSHTIYGLADDWAKQVEELRLMEGAQLLIERLAQGPESVSRLCSDVCLSSFEACQTLWALKLIGIVVQRQRTVRGGDRVPHEGRLEDTTLAELLVRLEREQATGVLYLHHGTVERSFFFGAGRCVFATSNDPDDGLVSYLFQRGIISLDDKEEMSRRLLTNRRVGTILREIGAIDDTDLQNMVRLQVSEIMHSTFPWEQGQFQFVPGPLPVAENITLSSSASAIVAEGIRRTTSWTRLVFGCGGIDNALCLTPHYLEVLDAMEASVAEWEVVSALRSPQTPRRICRLTEMSDFRVCQILWTLKLLGAVEDSPIDIEEPAAALPEPQQTTAASHEVETPAKACTDTDVDVPEEDEQPAFAAADSIDRMAHTGADAELRSLQNGDSGEVHVDMDARDHHEDDDDDDEADAWEPPAAVDQVIQRFNAMHRLVFRTIRTEVGAGAVNFVRSCCCGMSDDVPDPVEDVELYVDGSWSAEGLKTVIVEKRIEEPWLAYQAVLDREFITLLPILGERAAAELKRKIWEVQQAQETA